MEERYFAVSFCSLKSSPMKVIKFRNCEALDLRRSRSHSSRIIKIILEMQLGWGGCCCSFCCCCWKKNVLWSICICGSQAVHACINAKYFNLCKQARVAFFLWSMHESANSASWEIDSKVWATLWSSRELQYAGEGWGEKFHLAQIQHFLWLLP